MYLSCSVHLHVTNTSTYNAQTHHLNSQVSLHNTAQFAHTYATHKPTIQVEHRPTTRWRFTPHDTTLTIVTTNLLVITCSKSAHDEIAKKYSGVLKPATGRCTCNSDVWSCGYIDGKNRVTKIMARGYAMTCTQLVLTHLAAAMLG